MSFRHPLVLIVLFVSAMPVNAGFLPPSRHHQFQTFGLIHDDFISFWYGSNRRAESAIAGNLALVENESGSTQVVLSSSVISAQRFYSPDNVLNVETADFYVSFAVEKHLNDHLRMALGFRHLSGHVSEDLLPEEQFLTSVNSGVEVLYGRLVCDPNQYFRFGFTIKPNVHSDPHIPVFAADQFAEWQPWGHQSDKRNPTPFLALGLEESAVQTYILGRHARAGVYFGAHHDRERMAMVALVTGYYAGIDSRLKQAQFRHAQSEFVYAGLMASF